MSNLRSQRELLIEDLSIDSKLSILSFDIYQENNTNFNLELLEELVYLEGIFQHDKWKTFLDHSTKMQTNPCCVLINNNRKDMIHYALFYDSYNILKMILWNAKNFEKTDFKFNCTLEWTQMIAYEFFTYPVEILSRFFQSLLYRKCDVEILEWIFFSSYEFAKKVDKTKELVQYWNDILVFEDLRSVTIIYSIDDTVSISYPFWLR
jgi:hypothetical protein